jgi:hypothetical protein
MRLLYRCEGITGSPAIRPGMPLVWGSPYSAHTEIFYRPSRIDQAPTKGACRLDAIRPQRNGTAAIGEKPRMLRAGWPGAGIGVRPPDQDETPLSADEVVYLLPGYEVRA